MSEHQRGVAFSEWLAVTHEHIRSLAESTSRRHLLIDQLAVACHSHDEPELGRIDDQLSVPAALIG